MKRGFTLLLCLLLTLSLLASCTTPGGDDSTTTTDNNQTPPTPAHTHTYSDEWSYNTTEHWHAATCEHDTEVADKAAHTSANACTVCGYTAYTVTVTAPECVTVAGNLTAEKGSDVAFTLTAAQKYILTVDGAVMVGEPTIADGVVTYTYKVAAIAADTAVTVTAKDSTVLVGEATEGTGSITHNGGYDYYYSEITVNVPAAGKYAIWGATEGVEVNFGATEEGAELFLVYTFEATEAGTVTVKAGYFTWGGDAGTVEFAYNVVPYEDTLNVTVTEGADYTLPANVWVTLNVVFPVKGLYTVSSTAEGITWGTWYDDGEWAYVDEIGTQPSAMIEATEDAQAVALMVKVSDPTVTSFTFDWTIAPVDYVELVEGENTIKVPAYGSYANVKFVVTTPGAYTIDAGSDSIFVWNSEYGTLSYYWENEVYVADNMQAGDVICLYISDGDYGEEESDGTVTVSYLGSELVDNKATASADGVKNYFVADADGNYTVTAPDGALISVDGTEWSSSIEFTDVYADSQVAFLVKSDSMTEVELTIDFVTYNYTLYVGEDQEITLLPGAEYSFMLSGFQYGGMTVSFTLTWDNEAVQIKNMMMPVVSGEQVNDFQSWNALAVMNTSTEAVTVTFSLTEPEPEPAPQLSMGTNALEVTGEGLLVEFTAGSTGSYTLSAADGEENAWVMIYYSEFFTQEAELPYTFELYAGETLAFMVLPANWEADTIDLVLTLNSGAEQGGVADGDVMLPLLNGKYSVDFIMTGIYEITFTPASAGAANGTITVADNNNGKLTGTYNYTYSTDSGVVVTDSNGAPVNMLFSMLPNGSLSFQCDGLMMAQPMVPVAGGDDEGDDEGDTPAGNDGLVVGNNAVDVSDAWQGAHISFTATEAGTYVLTYAADETNGDVGIESMYGFETITMPYEFTLAAGESIDFIVLTANWEPDVIDLVIEFKGAAGGETPAGNDGLVVGNNAVDVSDAWQGAHISFTATEAGTYVLTYAADETNGDVGIESMYGFETITMPYEFTLAAGESIDFIVLTANWQPDVIDLVISVK